jgi:hypothetical protein
MALRTGIPAVAWLEDPNALMTACEILEEVQ